MRLNGKVALIDERGVSGIDHAVTERLEEADGCIIIRRSRSGQSVIQALSLRSA
jgi:hypothetical protein